MNVFAVYDESAIETGIWATDFRNLCYAEYNYVITVLPMSDYRVEPRSVLFLYCKDSDKLERFVKEYRNDRLLSSPRDVPLSKVLIGEMLENENDVYKMAEGLPSVSIIGIVSESFDGRIVSSALLPSYIGDKYLLDKNSTIHKQVVRRCLHVGVTPNLEIREGSYVVKKGFCCIM